MLISASQNGLDVDEPWFSYSCRLQHSQASNGGTHAIGKGYGGIATFANCSEKIVHLSFVRLFHPIAFLR